MSVVTPPAMDVDVSDRSAATRPLQVRRRVGGVSTDDVRNLLGAAVTSLTVTL